MNVAWVRFHIAGARLEPRAVAILRLYHDTLAQHGLSALFEPVRARLFQAGRALSDTQVAARAVMALSGTFDKYLSQQRASGWVEGSRQALTITRAGVDALGPFDPLPTGVDLQQHWLGELGAGKKSDMLRVLIAVYPSALADTQVALRADMARSGTFDKYLSQLRRLQLVDGPRSALRASEELFA